METQKTTINLPLSLWTGLKVRAGQDGTNQSEALRVAVWTYLYLRDRMDEGAEVLVRNGKNTERLILPGSPAKERRSGRSKETEG